MKLSDLPLPLTHAAVVSALVALALTTLLYGDAVSLPLFSDDLRQEMYAYLREKHRAERKPDQTEAQFIYSTRKRALGPFKRQVSDLPD